MSPAIDLTDPKVIKYLTQPDPVFGTHFEKRRIRYGAHIVGRKRDTCHCGEPISRNISKSSLRRLTHVTQQYGIPQGYTTIFPDRCDPETDYQYQAWKEIHDNL